MFPDYLDGAEVLEYTNKGYFGKITDYDENGVPYDREVCYLAVTRYKGDENYYIFSCDQNFEVIADSCFWTVEICKTCHEFWETAVWHSK